MRKPLIFTGGMLLFLWIYRLYERLIQVQGRVQVAELEIQQLRREAKSLSEDAQRWRHHEAKLREMTAGFSQDEDAHLATLSADERIDYRMKQAIVQSRREERLQQIRNQENQEQ